MKKIFIILIASLLLLVGCEEKANDKRIEEQRVEISTLEKEISELKGEKESLHDEVIDAKIEKGLEKYIITLEIKQSHMLDVGKMIKDEMNAIEIQIPTDKEYYDSLEVGDLLDDSFRFGSFLLEGSFGNWKIKVVDKEIK